MDKTFSLFETLENFDMDVSKYLYSLLASLCNVESSYIQYNGYGQVQDFEHVERVFAYELYRQWCNHPIINNCKSLVVNAEIPKQLVENVRRDGTLSLKYPDMILHKGQNDYKENYIVCEIKREEYARQHPDKLMEDFHKLNIYLSDELKVKSNLEDWEPFKIGVFILTKRNDRNGVSVKRVKELLGEKTEQIMHFSNKIRKRIICVVYDGKELRYDTLSNII